MLTFMKDCLKILCRSISHYAGAFYIMALVIILRPIKSPGQSFLLDKI